MPTIKVGENAIMTKVMTSTLDSYSLLQAEIRQNNKVMASYQFTPVPDPVQSEIRDGGTTSTLEVELTKEVSDRLIAGDVYLRVISEKADASFDVDGVKKDIDDTLEFTVE